MGVEWINCDKCGDIFCDCGEYDYCENCDMYFCISCSDKLNRSYFSEDGSYLEKCSFCQGEDITDAELLKFLLKKCGVTKREAIVMAKEKSND